MNINLDNLDLRNMICPGAATVGAGVAGLEGLGARGPP